jgi:hypothetical protein
MAAALNEKRDTVNLLLRRGANVKLFNTVCC